MQGTVHVEWWLVLPVDAWDSHVAVAERARKAHARARVEERVSYLRSSERKPRESGESPPHTRAHMSQVDTKRLSHSSRTQRAAGSHTRLAVYGYQ